MNPFLDINVLWNLTRDVRNESISVNAALDELIKITQQSHGQLVFYGGEFVYQYNDKEYLKYCNSKSTSILKMGEGNSTIKTNTLISVMEDNQYWEVETMNLIASTFQNVYNRLSRKGKVIFVDRFIYLNQAKNTMQRLKIGTRAYYREMTIIKKNICKELYWFSKQREREAVLNIYTKVSVKVSDPEVKKLCQEFLEKNLTVWKLEDSL